jgi:hypothetical protein
VAAFCGIGAFRVRHLAMLNDRAPAETDRHARFVRNLNRFVRVGYEVCTLWSYSCLPIRPWFSSAI